MGLFGKTTQDNEPESVESDESFASLDQFETFDEYIKARDAFRRKKFLANKRKREKIAIREARKIKLLKNIPLYVMVLDANTQAGYYLVMPLTSKNEIREGALYKVDPENLTIFPPEKTLNQTLEDESYFDTTMRGNNKSFYYDEGNILEALDDTIKDLDSRLEKFGN